MRSSGSADLSGAPVWQRLTRFRSVGAGGVGSKGKDDDSRIASPGSGYDQLETKLLSLGAGHNAYQIQQQIRIVARISNPVSVHQRD